jgi:hypothetical protein
MRLPRVRRSVSPIAVRLSIPLLRRDCASSQQGANVSKIEEQQKPHFYLIQITKQPQ